MKNKKKKKDEEGKAGPFMELPGRIEIGGFLGVREKRGMGAVKRRNK